MELDQAGPSRGSPCPMGFHSGAYRLVVNELLDTKGARLVWSSWSALRGGRLPELSDHARRAHYPGPGRRAAAHAACRSTERGQRVGRSVKAVDRSRGEPVELAFDEDGRAVDPDELPAAIAKRRLERFGKFEEALAPRVEGAQQRRDGTSLRLGALEAPPKLPTSSLTGRRANGPQPRRELDAEVKGATKRLLRDLGHEDIKRGTAFRISADGRGGGLSRAASRARP